MAPVGAAIRPGPANSAGAIGRHAETSASANRASSETGMQKGIAVLVL